MIGWLIKIVLFLLLLIGVVLMVVLFTPVKYTITGKKDDDSQVRIHVSWLFNLIKVVAFFRIGEKPETDFLVFRRSISVEGGPKKEKKPPKPKKKKPRKKKKKKGIPPKHILNKSILKPITVLLNDFFKWLKPKKFRLNGMVGFEDPYHTGILCSFLYSFNEPLHDNGINIIPVFDREVLEADFEIEGKHTIAVLLLIFIKFAFSKPIRKLILYQIRR